MTQQPPSLRHRPPASSGADPMAPPPTLPPPPRRRLARWLHWTRVILGGERLWTETWVLRSLLLASLALLLSGVPASLPGWLHVGLLATLGLACLVAALLAARGLHWPNLREAIRRQEASTPHRPLTASLDRLSQGGDPLTETLWTTHKVRARQQAATLRPPVPCPDVARRDPWGLRVLPVLALTVAMAAAWPDPLARLAASLTPALTPSAPTLALDVWITPPAYTGLPPLTRSLNSRDGDSRGDGGPTDDPGSPNTPLNTLFEALPAGSQLHLMIHDDRALRLRLDDTPIPVEAPDPGLRRATLLLNDGGPHTLSLSSRWSTLLSWPITVIPDEPPHLAWATPESPPSSFSRPSSRPPSGADTLLSLSLTGEDDWGFTTLSLEMRRNGQTAPLRPLPLSGTPRTLPSPMTVDLTAHPWAGLEVELRATGTDAVGHSASTGWVTVTLPERPFSHPVARRLAETRKTLMRATESTGLSPVIGALQDISVAPSTYNDDPVTFLALRVATLRTHALLVDGQVRPEARDPIASLLWSLALRIEDGPLDDARQALEQARQALSEALRTATSPEEIQAAVEQVRQAAAAYFRELIGQMAETGDIPLSALGPLSVSAESIDRMASTLEELTRLGATEAAQRVMDRLSQALTRLQSARSLATPASTEALRKTLDALRDIAATQEALLQKSFDLHREEPMRRRETPSRFAREGGLYAAEQGQLADRLHTLLSALPPAADGQPTPPPPSLTDAETAMRDAVSALMELRWDAGQAAQTRALEALKKGQTDSMAALLQGLDGGLVVMPGPSGLNRDPTGRGPGVPGLEGQALPDRPERARAWDLMQELRRRANERHRDPEEKDYLRRLLKVF